MTYQYCSDLHLEIPLNNRWLKDHPITPKADILLIAGDLLNLEEGYQSNPFFDRISQQFKLTYILPGNHEYYKKVDVTKHLAPTHEAIRDNIFLVNNTIIQPDPETALIFTTLWSRITSNYGLILKYIADFKKIYFRGTLLTIPQFNQLHEHCLAFLRAAVAETQNLKQIVVSHHLPSPLCNVSEFKDSKMNGAFCVDLTDFIQSSGIDVWVYGHSHRNKAPFRIGNTMLLTNQLGYLIRKEHTGYQSDKTFDLKNLSVILGGT